MSKPPLDQRSIDLLSSALQRAVIEGRKLPEIEIVTWFFNALDGPQFGEPRDLPTRYCMQPLYATPANPSSEPVAWKDKASPLVTQDRTMYREDIDWMPLYLARNSEGGE